MHREDKKEAKRMKKSEKPEKIQADEMKKHSSKGVIKLTEQNNKKYGFIKINIRITMGALFIVHSYFMFIADL